MCKDWDILTVQFLFLRQCDLMKQHGLCCNLGTYYNAFFLGAIFLLFKDLKEIITATGHRKLKFKKRLNFKKIRYEVVIILAMLLVSS